MFFEGAKEQILKLIVPDFHYILMFHAFGLVLPFPFE